MEPREYSILRLAGNQPNLPQTGLKVSERHLVRESRNTPRRLRPFFLSPGEVLQPKEAQ